jgi:hypothetical protein
MTQGTQSKLGAVAMAALLVFSVLTVAVAPAMAAVGNVEMGQTSYSIDEDVSQTVVVNVTDDGGSTGSQKVVLDITDSTGTSVYNTSKTVSINAGATKSVEFVVDPATQGIGPGSYKVQGSAGSLVSNASDLTVNDVQEPSVAWGQTGYEIFASGGDSNTVEYTLTAGDRDTTSNVTVSVIDPNGNTTFSTVDQDVSVGAGNTTTGTVTLASSDVDMTGTHSIEVSWSGATMGTDLTVSDPSNPAVRAGTYSSSMYNSSDAQDLPVTLAAGDYNQTGDLSVTITDDATGNVVYESTKTSVSVAAGETKSTSFSVASDDLDAGNYSVSYSWEGDSAQSALTVEEGEGDTVVAGGVIDDANPAQILIVLAALITILMAVAAVRD